MDAWDVHFRKLVIQTGIHRENLPSYISLPQVTDVVLVGAEGLKLQAEDSRTMTSYLPPDYDLALEITPEDAQKIAGIAFTCGIDLEGQGSQRGMVIVPEGRGVARIGQTTEAYLWADKNLCSPVGTSLRITIGDPCDPLFLRQFQTLAAHKGLAFAGVITRIRTSDAEWGNAW